MMTQKRAVRNLQLVGLIDRCMGNHDHQTRLPQGVIVETRSKDLHINLGKLEAEAREALATELLEDKAPVEMVIGNRMVLFTRHPQSDANGWDLYYAIPGENVHQSHRMHDSHHPGHRPGVRENTENLLLFLASALAQKLKPRFRKANASKDDAAGHHGSPHPGHKANGDDEQVRTREGPGYRLKGHHPHPGGSHHVQGSSDVPSGHADRVRGGGLKSDFDAG